MPFVLDNWVVSGWLLESQATPYANAVSERLLSDRALAPASNGMAVATRESAPFVAMGVAVINPWGCVMAGCRMARHAVPCSPMFKP